MASLGLSSSHSLWALPKLEQQSWVVLAIGQEAGQNQLNATWPLS